MKKLSEKAFKLLARAKTNAADNGVSRLNIHCIEAAFLDLYRSFLLTTVRKDRIMIAVDAMSTAMRTRNVSVSHIGLDREIQDFLEGSETETLTLPDFWTLVCSSPNSAFNAEALGEEAVEKLTETFRKIENGEAPSIGGVGGEMPMDGEDSFDWHTCCVDLVEQVKDYKKPFIGREDVIEDTIRTLVRMDKCNPCHVGEPGVGKTAVTLGLARKIATGDVPKALKNASLFEVDLAGMLAGSVFRGQFEQRLKTTLEGVLEESENPILFIDEIHTIVGAGSTGTSSMDASNILKPFLTEGKIKFIGATTYDEYRQHIEKDKALARRFQKIDIVEPSIEDAIKIVDGLKDAYGEHHGVTYHSEAIESAVRLSAKYMTDRFLPDKAIDLIDEAGAHHNIHPELGKDIVGADIEQVLTRLCHIPKITNEEEDFNSVRNLESALNERG